MRRLTSLIAVCALAMLVVAAVAEARPGNRGFIRTYPHASRLCTKVANGHTPKRLAGSTDKVTAACADLKTAFTKAQNDYNTAAAPLKQQATDALKALRETCRAARTAGDPATCKQARQDTRTTIKGLRSQVNVAAKTYIAAVRAARKAFWDTIHTLKGGTTLKPDTTTGSPPSTVLPTDKQVDAA